MSEFSPAPTLVAYNKGRLLSEKPFYVNDSTPITVSYNRGNAFQEEDRCLKMI
jgi:hypothetical protein